jgi:putative transposase
MVKNSKLAKSISDASWSMFRRWLEYFGTLYGVVTVPVPPQYTSQKCSSCGVIVKKTLSIRTHKCSCGAELCRDENAAKNILELGLRNAGHVLTSVLNTENACGQDYLYYRNGDGAVASSVVEAGKSQSDLGISF